MMRTVTILGSTGSIGTQALDVIEAHPGMYRVVGIGAGGANIALLAEQAARFAVDTVAVAREDVVTELADALAEKGVHPEIVAGSTAMSDLAGREGIDVVLNGITGSIGLEPTLKALKAGATLALANKESIVAGSALISKAMVRPGQIVPVDSEHSAIAQALQSGCHRKGLTVPEVDGTTNVKRLILTASGGPFRGKKKKDLRGVTADEALKHPTWAMGPVVTINSSTLMNKALELIEASYLFDVDPADIVPVIHPQSVIHSMVEFIDGSTIAQASPPDMRLPIALGLSWPERMNGVVPPCRWDAPLSWDFEPLDNETFPAIHLARQAISSSWLHPAVMNAVNEECVEAFLQGKIPYLSIVETVETVLEDFETPHSCDLETVWGVESWARKRAKEIMESTQC